MSTGAAILLGMWYCAATFFKNDSAVSAGQATFFFWFTVVVSAFAWWLS